MLKKGAKAQAAMEFLLTYGWAIMVVLCAISAMAYFGVLNWDKWFPPNRCDLPTGLSCMDHRVYVYSGGSNRLELNIQNNLGAKIYIDKIDFPAYGVTGRVVNREMLNGQRTSTPESPNNIKISDITDVTNNGAFASGQKYKIDFTLHYLNRDAGDLPHAVKGQIVGIVQ